MEKKLQEAYDAFQKKFPTREGYMGFQVIMLSQTEQPCDVTFYERKPILEVTIDKQIGLAMVYGAGPEKLAEMMSAIKFSEGIIPQRQVRESAHNPACALRNFHNRI